MLCRRLFLWRSPLRRLRHRRVRRSRRVRLLQSAQEAELSRSSLAAVACALTVTLTPRRARQKNYPEPRARSRPLFFSRSCASTTHTLDCSNETSDACWNFGLLSLQTDNTLQVTLASRFWRTSARKNLVMRISTISELFGSTIEGTTQEKVRRHRPECRQGTDQGSRHRCIHGLYHAARGV